jgi:serine/threonine kinase PknH
MAPNQSGPIPQVSANQTGTHQHPGRPYVPPVPPPQHKPTDPERRRNGWMIAAAVTGVVLLLAVFALLTWLGSSGRLALPWQEESDPQEQPAEVEPEDQSDPADEEGSGPGNPNGELPEGAIGLDSDGLLEFTVSEPECGQFSHGDLTIENASFCEFSVAVVNVSAQDVELDHTWQELDNAEAGVHQAMRPTPEQRREPLWQTIPEGERVQGTMVFPVEHDHAAEELILRSSESSEGVRIAIPPEATEGN